MAQNIDMQNWQAVRCEIQGIKFAYDPDCMSIDELNELQSDMAEMAKKMKEMSENLFDLIRQKEYPQ